MILKRQEKNGKIKAMYSSSTICGSIYDKNTKELTVIFNNGGQYKYPNVEASDYMRIETAESNGTAFTKYVKNKYQIFEKLEKLSESSINAILKEVSDLKSSEENQQDEVIQKESDGYISNLIEKPNLTTQLDKIVEMYNNKEITSFEYQVLIYSFEFLNKKGVISINNN